MTLKVYPAYIIMMVAGMKRMVIETALRRQGCTPAGSGRGPHDKWTCPCGSHTANIPRHREISNGVVRGIRDRMICLPEGWL